MEIRVLVCPCGYEVPIHPLGLQGITSHPIGKPNSDAYVNFVCPGCGLCTHYLAESIPARSFQVPNLRRTTLLHVDLKCVAVLCPTRATVHTKPESGMPNAVPMKEVRSWQVGHIRCPSEHFLIEPAVVTATRITNPDD